MWPKGIQVPGIDSETSCRSHWERSRGGLDCKRGSAEEQDDAIEAAAREIRELDRGSKMALAIGIGRVVMERIYKGNRLLLRSGYRHDGLGKLAQRADVAYCKTSLWRFAGCYELVTRVPWVRDEPRLTFGHVRSVLSIPRPEQEGWLREAVSNGWNAKELGDRVKESRRGRRNPTEPVLLLRTARRVCQLEEQVPIPGRRLTRRETKLLRTALAKLRNLERRLEWILDNE